MKRLLKNADVFYKGELSRLDVLIEDGVIAEIGAEVSDGVSDDIEIYDLRGYCLLPGLADVHVHFREPGFSYKETIKTGTKAAAHGGYTLVCPMPNLDPVPDSIEHLQKQVDVILSDAVIDVVPFGSITVGEKGERLSDIDSLARHVAGFSDDGRGVESDELMLRAMKKVKRQRSVISAHCETERLKGGNHVHAGTWQQRLSIEGISSESEYDEVRRNIELSEKTGCRLHICHVSTKESIELIRAAKKRGAKVTAETGPHYLTLTEDDMEDDGRFKMNPPIRTAADRDALIEGIKDGTIDVIATDHAPHSAEEKSKGLRGSLMGVVGLETAFAIVYTKLVKTGIITLKRAVELMSTRPREVFGFMKSDIEVGNKAQLAAFDLEREYTVDPDDFLSMGRSTPFEGEKVFGKTVLTVLNDEIVYEDTEVKKN